LIVLLGAGLPIPLAFPVPHTGSTYVDVDLVVWPVLVAALLVVSPKEWSILRHDLVARLLIAFLAVSALSVPFGAIAYHNLSGVWSFGYFVLILCNFGVGYLVLRTVEDVDLLIRSFVAPIGVISLPMTVYLLQAGILERVHQFHNSTAIRSTVYGWPNAYSVLLAIGLVLSLYVCTTAATRLVRRIYVVFAIGITACLILTFSKTGWVALAVALWFLWLRFWSVKRAAVVVAALVVAGIVLFLASNESFRMQVFTIETVGERLQFFAIVLRDVNPLILLTGSGSQSVELLMAAYANQQLVPTVGLASLSPHDEFLNVLIKSGVVGLILMVAALTVVVLRGRRVARAASPHSVQLARYWYATSWAVIISLFAGEELHYWPVAALFFLLAGAAVHLLPSAEPRKSANASPRAVVGSTRAAEKPG
jgi:O-antigen ligase